MPRLAAFKGTKARVLRYLMQHQQATINELATTLELTRACIHNHLHDLSQAGLVSRRSSLEDEDEETAGRGRPCYCYSLTEQGESCFPRDYVGLAREVLEQVKACFGSEGLRKVLEKRNASWSAHWHDELADKPLEKRFAVLAKQLSQDNFYDAESQGASQNVQLRLGNCPYWGVAQHYPEICAAEKKMLEDSLGVGLEQSELRTRGDGCCCYRLLTDKHAAESKAVPAAPPRQA